MEPLKPDEKKSILANNPQAQPDDLEEYERLLSLRFTEDPDANVAAEPTAEEAETPRARLERRIGELHRKLFPSASNSATQRRR